ncbi:MAG: DNA cytosine methyltransferase [Vicinamibacteria bacterium]
MTAGTRPPRALDFFAGSGLVRLGLEPEFETAWANDISPKKALVHRANFDGDAFELRDIQEVSGAHLPSADLAWASFPCQDLSLAGNLNGMKAGTRSGLFWEWMRVLDEMAQSKRAPRILVAENVVGFLVANDGADFRTAYRALRDRGYLVGAIVVDAKSFLPQSRPRAFLIAVKDGLDLRGLVLGGPSAPFHPASVVRAAAAVADPDWLWWSLPIPSIRVPRFSDICERHAPAEEIPVREIQKMLSSVNKEKLDAALQVGRLLCGTGYKRTRPVEDGSRRTFLELRFDGVAGCLRTPEGGSSRQTVVLVDKGRVRTRLLTVRECARLMGAPDSFRVPGTYNDGYRAMGDAVAVPVTRWLAQHLLLPMAQRRARRRAA